MPWFSYTSIGFSSRKIVQMWFGDEIKSSGKFAILYPCNIGGGRGSRGCCGSSPAAAITPVNRVFSPAPCYCFGVHILTAWVKQHGGSYHTTWLFTCPWPLTGVLLKKFTYKIAFLHKTDSEFTETFDPLNEWCVNFKSQLQTIT